MGDSPANPVPADRGARLPKLLLALAVLVALGITTVWEHVRAVRAGYRLHALEVQRERLREEQRRLELRRAREERLDVLEERARRLGLEVPGLTDRSNQSVDSINQLIEAGHGGA